MAPPRPLADRAALNFRNAALPHNLSSGSGWSIYAEVDMIEATTKSAEKGKDATADALRADAR
ncbi:MAG: hypothetical protein WA943_07360 [Parvibaculum sp.]|uniref:hypothetical protein n=1 Tax=Parvibaculum sp. TaxID=2024848 RepID=UPI003C769A58